MHHAFLASDVSGRLRVGIAAKRNRREAVSSALHQVHGTVERAALHETRLPERTYVCACVRSNKTPPMIRAIRPPRPPYRAVSRVLLVCFRAICVDRTSLSRHTIGHVCTPVRLKSGGPVAERES